MWHQGHYEDLSPPNNHSTDSVNAVGISHISGHIYIRPVFNRKQDMQMYPNPEYLHLC